MASFWDEYGPGLLNTGLQIGGSAYLGNRASQEAQKRLRAAQGPLYNQQQDMAKQSLDLARGMDPNKMAADRFAAQQALVAPGEEAQRLALMSKLQKQGMLDSASFAPVAGTVATPGVAMNPQMAALFAAQQGARSQAAYQSMSEGQKYLDDLLKRGGMLQTQAQNQQGAGIKAQFGDKYTGLPAKPSITEQIVKGGINILKDPKALKNVAGLFGQGMDWAKKLFAPSVPAYSFGGSATPNISMGDWF